MFRRGGVSNELQLRASSPRLLSAAEPRRIARLNADARDRIAYPLLPRLTLGLGFNAPLAGGF
jgi:hypothetical protein